MAIITSIQRGSISQTSTSNTATISSVDTSKSIVVMSGWLDTNTSSTDIEEYMCRLDLQNATTVRSRRDTDGGQNLTVYFAVIEFDEIIDSVQQIEITLAHTGSLTGTATISSVDTSRAGVLWLGHETTEPANDWNQSLARLDLTNDTTVTATRSSTTNGITINGVVVEFTDAAVDLVETGTLTISATSTGATDSTLGFTDMNNTIIFHGGMEFTGSTSDTYSDGFADLEMTSNIQIAATRADNEGTLEINWTGIEFVDGVMQSVNRDRHDIGNSNASTTDSFSTTLTDTDFACPLFMGRHGNANHDDSASALTAISTTQITLTRDGSFGECTTGWEVWEFVDGSLGGTAYTITADGGSYTITGTAANLEYHAVLGADGGSYAVTGQDAALEYAIVFDAESGSYSVSGQDASLLASYVLAASAGSYAVTGSDANLERSVVISAENGSYTVTGAAAELLTGYLLSSESGSYALGGTDASLLATFVLSAEAGSYAYTGQDATLTYDLANTISADGGSYIVGGSDVGFNYTGSGPIISGNNRGPRASARCVLVR